MMGHCDGSDNLPLYAVNKLQWLGNVVKLMTKLKPLLTGRPTDILSRSTKQACSDVITALGYSSRETEKLVTRPIEGLMPCNMTPAEKPWYWDSPGAGPNIRTSPEMGGQSSGSGSSPRLREARPAAASIASHLASARSRNNLPRGAGLQLDHRRDKAQNLRAMRDQVKWYANSRSTNPNARQFYLSNNGGPGKRNLGVNQACELIWEKFGEEWRSKVNLRNRDEPTNIPEGH